MKFTFVECYLRVVVSDGAALEVQPPEGGAGRGDEVSAAAPMARRTGPGGRRGCRPHALCFRRVGHSHFTPGPFDMALQKEKKDKHIIIYVGDSLSFYI